MPDSNPLRPGQKFGNGRFILIRFLGRGGMGEVWLAEDERLQEQVALKFLPPEIRGDPVALDDLRRETARSHRLTHPNIVRINDLHEDADGTAFIIMEYIDGPTLAALRLEQPNRVLTWNYLRPLLGQLCSALDYAHGEKVIHRDLKAANMMIDSRGRLKLADFGIAAVASDSIGRASGQDSISGTLLYMSPQQLTGKRAQATDDIYALGATLYELLTSQPPFHAGDLTHQILRETPEPMEERLVALEIQNEIPPEASTMIMACLGKEAEQRPQNARTAAEWIGLEIVRKPSLAALSKDLFLDEPAAPPDIEWPVPSSRKKPLWAVGVFATLLLLATGGWYWINHKPARKETNHTKIETAVAPTTIKHEPVSNPIPAMNVRSFDTHPLKLPRPSLNGKPSGNLVIWGKGYGNHKSSMPPSGMGPIVDVSSGGFHTLALTRDEKVWAWGAGNVNTGTDQEFGQSMVPNGLEHVVAVAAGWDHSLALRQDGTVVGWGRDNDGQADPPAGLTNAIAIAAGIGYSTALTSEGLVRVWGRNDHGQANVPLDLNHVVGIAAGWSHVLALKSDGTVVAWGNNDSGQAIVPSGLSNVIAIAAGEKYSGALKADGDLVFWGEGPVVQGAPPISDVVAIAGGGNHVLTLKRDGKLIAWGNNGAGQTRVPPALNHIIAIATGHGHSMALTTGMTVSPSSQIAHREKPVSATVFVSGKSNPWLAGMPDGSTSGSDSAPAESPVRVANIPLSPGAILTFSATGDAANGAPPGYGGAGHAFGPTGNAAGTVSHAGGAQNGIGDIRVPITALLGVFLDDSIPSGSPPPAIVRFGKPSMRDFLKLQPELRQPFFIGTGVTSKGEVQQFVVPKGATRLFLGIMDGYNWFDNFGGFNVTVTRLPAISKTSAASLAAPSSQ